MALTVYFLTRYVKQRDEFEKQVIKDITEIPEKIKETVKDIKDAIHSVKKHQESLDNQIMAFKSGNIELRGKINEGLVNIEKHIVHIESGLERTNEKAERLSETLTKMNERVQFHDKVLTGLAQATKEGRAKLTEHDAQLKTVTEKIGETLILVKTKVPSDKS